MTPGDERIYQFRVAGHLDGRWSAWFEGLAIAGADDGTCTLTGPVADQAQLHGILARLRDLGATLLSLRTLDTDDERLSVRRADPARDLGVRRHVGC